MMNLEHFNELYQKRIDLLYHKHVDQESDMYSYFTGYNFTFKRVPFYKVPPKIIEFCSIANSMVKLFAFTFTICIDSPIYLQEEHTYVSNYLDWVMLMQDINKGKFYVNCNPQSQHYGHILVTYPQLASNVIYKCISELVAEIEEWMKFTSAIPEFNVDEFLDEKYISCPVMFCYRDLFAECVHNMDSTDIAVLDYVYEKIKRKSSYKDRSARIFSYWLYIKSAKK